MQSEGAANRPETGDLLPELTWPVNLYITTIELRAGNLLAEYSSILGERERQNTAQPPSLREESRDHKVRAIIPY